ncbi:MAG TPA: hypothetical protein VEY91_06410 [Candidatus Limnocylindria bacterium]|nr:hypothetical protein [Candidatus Limnocylindria bacterium]
MKHFGIETARTALTRWDGDPATLEHLATSGNDVYRFHAGEPRILRITDRAYRTFAEQGAEMAFLRHLDDRGVRVAAPLPSRAGELLETLDDCSACVLSWAPGVRVDPGSPDWDLPFFREWGRNLAEIHLAAQSYTGPGRWEWWEEGLLAVISLSTLRRQAERDRHRDAILAGYQEVLALPEIWAERWRFLRLRIHYVYLSRLEMFGSQPSAEQKSILTTLRQTLREPIVWP